jgi:glycerophosphoryl diester phosphodiesterase
VQADAPGTELSELVHRVDGVERRARRLAEGIAAGVADRPQSKGEAGFCHRFRNNRAYPAREAVRPANAAYDGRFEIPTFQEVLDLRARLSRELHRPIGIYPETKHPTYFRSIGLPLEPRLVRALDRNGLNTRHAPVFVQSFEQDNLRALRSQLKVPLVQLLDTKDLHPAGDPHNPTYGELATPAGLRSIARYAAGVGPSKDHIVPRDLDDDSSGTPTSFVRDAHAAGLVVHPYTFRRENKFLPLELRSSADPKGIGDLESEIRQFFALGVDGVFTDNADIGVAARRSLRPSR